MLLITSDPVISSLRNVQRKKSGKMPSDVLELLISPIIDSRMTEEAIPSSSESSSVATYYHDYSTADSFEDSDDDECLSLFSICK